MDPVFFIEIAHTFVDYVDETYGRLPAWLAALAIIVLFPVVLLALIAAAVWGFSG